MKLKHSFYEDVEKDMKYVLYSDTDSLYINLQNYKVDNLEDSIKKGYDISDLINGAIQEYVNGTLIKKMGIAAIHNQIDFKTEYLIGSLILLDVKKNYAYKLVAKEGNILPVPKIEYTGIPVVKTDSSKFTQNFIRSLVEDIALNDKLDQNQLHQMANTIIIKKHSEMEDAIHQLDFALIGSPKKWGSRKYVKDPYQVVGMKLWNTLTSDNFFTPASSGLHIPIIIRSINNFNKLINDNKFINEYTIGNTQLSLLTSLVVPYKYDKSQIQDLFSTYNISIDNESLWEKRLYNVTARRILNVIKKQSI